VRGSEIRIGVLELKESSPCCPPFFVQGWFVPRNFLKKVKLRLLS
jgi:hypothetical protein